MRLPILILPEGVDADASHGLEEGLVLISLGLVAVDQVVEDADDLIDRYKAERDQDETFLETVRRVGVDTFRENQNG